MENVPSASQKTNSCNPLLEMRALKPLSSLNSSGSSGQMTTLTVSNVLKKNESRSGYGQAFLMPPAKANPNILRVDVSRQLPQSLESEARYQESTGCFAITIMSENCEVGLRREGRWPAEMGPWLALHLNPSSAFMSSLLVAFFGAKGIMQLLRHSEKYLNGLFVAKVDIQRKYMTSLWEFVSDIETEFYRAPTSICLSIKIILCTGKASCGVGLVGLNVLYA